MPIGMLSLSPSELADLAEGLRQKRRYAEAREALERCLEQNPKHPRGLLLLGWLHYQEGKLPEALQTLRALEAILGRDESIKTLTVSLEQLLRKRDLQTDPAFVTETMAGLLVEQGYLLEAMGIYRQLFLASGGEKRLWEKILFLRARLGQEGSRDAQTEKVAGELELLDRWIQAQKRED